MKIHFPPAAPAELNACCIGADQVRGLLSGTERSRAVLSGPEACALMRLAGTTVPEVARRWKVTQERVRQIRRAGTTGIDSVAEWVSMLTKVPQPTAMGMSVVSDLTPSGVDVVPGSGAMDKPQVSKANLH